MRLSVSREAKAMNFAHGGIARISRETVFSDRIAGTAGGGARSPRRVVAPHFVTGRRHPVCRAGRRSPDRWTAVPAPCAAQASLRHRDLHPEEPRRFVRRPPGLVDEAGFAFDRVDTLALRSALVEVGRPPHVRRSVRHGDLREESARGSVPVWYPKITVVSRSSFRGCRMRFPRRREPRRIRRPSV